MGRAWWFFFFIGRRLSECFDGTTGMAEVSKVIRRLRILPSHVVAAEARKWVTRRKCLKESARLGIHDCWVVQAGVIMPSGLVRIPANGSGHLIFGSHRGRLGHGFARWARGSALVLG